MKESFVAQLEPEQGVTSFFLVFSKETRTGRSSGKAYLELELGDRTGTIPARMFDNVEAAAACFRVDDVVKVQGRVQMFNGRRQMVVEKIRAARPGEFELADFLPHTRHDVEALYSRLREFVAGVENAWLRRLLEDVTTDEALVPRLKRAPAGKTMHHAFIGGLLEHVVSLCSLCRAVAPLYPEIDGDLLLAGAVLHDIGKLDELTCDRAFGYSAEGQLLGHIVLELELLAKKMDAIEGFPPALKTIVKHLCASHHGSLEFGSPAVPRIPEAVMLHYLDDLDSKLAAMRASYENETSDGEWTARNIALGRTLLRLDRFLAGEAKAAPGPPAEEESDK